MLCILRPDGVVPLPLCSSGSFILLRLDQAYLASTHSFDGGFGFVSDESECWQGFQGPKLTFSGRRQLATGFFFQLPYGKMWSPKSVNKTFCSQGNTNLNFWSPIFLLRIITKRTHLGPQWQFFRSRIRVNTNTLIIYTPTTEKPRQMN